MSADVYLILVTKEGIVREHWWGSSMACQLSKYLSNKEQPKALMSFVVGGRTVNSLHFSGLV